MKNKKLTLTIIGVIGLVLITIALSYAYWLITKTQNQQNIITSACLDIELTNEKNDINLQQQYPISDEDGMKLTPYEFTVTNNCNVALDYQIALEATGDEINSLKASSLKVALDSNYKLYSDYSETSTTAREAYASRIIGYSVLGAKNQPNSSVTHKLRIWIDKDAPIDERNKTFASKVTVTVGQTISNPFKSGTLANSILANAYGGNAIRELSSEKTIREVEGVTRYPDQLMHFGSDYTYQIDDSGYVYYSLSGDVVEATFLECVNGQKEDGTKINCGKYIYDEDYGQILVVPQFSAESIEDSEYGEVVYLKSLVYLNEYSLPSTGLYKIEDDLGYSYYFRGDVENNYVQFGRGSALKLGTDTVKTYSFYNTYECGDEEDITSCTLDGPYDDIELCNFHASEQGGFECFESGSKEVEVVKTIENVPYYWRIVRINGDGTIRLVYDGYNTNEKKEEYETIIGTAGSGIGYYTYNGENNQQIDSNIKSIVDSWYEKNLKNNYGSDIVDSIFCNDKEMLDGYNEGDDYITFKSTERISSSGSNDNLNPSLKCKKEYRYTLDGNLGNGYLKYPIGLMAVDEVALAAPSNISYLGTLDTFFTMTPGDYNIDSGTGLWAYSGSEGIYLPEYWYSHYVEEGSFGVRPVINLRADVTFDGNGTKQSPFVITTN